MECFEAGGVVLGVLERRPQPSSQSCRSIRGDGRPDRGGGVALVVASHPLASCARPLFNFWRGVRARPLPNGSAFAREI